MNIRTLALAVAAVAVLGPGKTVARSLDARLDRALVHDDETVRLIVEADTQAGGLEPDLAPLRRDFEVLGQSTSTHVSIGNGARNVRTEWTIELAPKRPGRFTIGPIRVGTMTSPAVELEVLPSSAAARSARDVFLEVEVTPRETYVQAQLVCVLRVYRAAEFLEAKLSDFDPDQAVTYRLGRDSTYSKTIDGRRYRVIERRFAVFPQASGPLTLPGFRLDARIADPGAASTMGQLFGEGRRVRIETRPVEVAVKPRPGADATPWLPATAVTFSAQWTEEPPRLVVGEPVTWTLRLDATGLAGEQLPPIEPPGIEGVRIYPDQPSIATRSSAEAVHGERIQHVALVPGTAGALVIPEMRVQWWDVEADAPRTAVIPARTLSVAPAPVSAAAPRPALAEPPAAAPQKSARPWQIASAALALAWLATLGVLLRTRGRRRGIAPRAGAPAGESPPNTSAARQAVLDACNASDPREARRALLGWAELAWPGPPPRDLIAVAARVRDERFGEAIMALDRALWSGRGAVWNGRSMATVLPREIGPPPAPRRRDADNRLPSLHPA